MALVCLLVQEGRRQHEGLWGLESFGWSPSQLCVPRMATHLSWPRLR